MGHAGTDPSAGEAVGRSAIWEVDQETTQVRLCEDGSFLEQKLESWIERADEGARTLHPPEDARKSSDTRNAGTGSPRSERPSRQSGELARGARTQATGMLPLAWLEGARLRPRSLRRRCV